MKKFVKFLMFIEYFVAIGCLYYAFFHAFPHLAINVGLGTIGVVTLLDALGKSDEINGYGKDDS